MARRWLKIAAWAAGGIAVFLGLVWLALWALAASDWGRAQVQELIAGQVKEATGAEFTLGDLSGNPLTNLVLSDLRLTREGRVLAQADQVELRYNPLALLGGSIRLGRLRLLHPRVNLPLDLPQAAPSAGPIALRLSIAHLEVVDGALMAGGQLGQLDSAEQINLEGRFLLSGAGPRLEGNISYAELNLAGRPQPATLRTTFTLKGDKLALASLAVRSGPSRVEARGSLDFKAAPELHLQAWGRLADWRHLAQYYPDFAPAPMPLDFNLEANGGLAKLHLQAEVKIEDGGRLGLTAEANLDQPALKLEAVLSALDLQRAGLSPDPVSLRGLLKLASQGWPGLPDSRGSLVLELNDPGWEQWQAKALELRLTQDGRKLTVERLSASAGFGSLEAQGSLTLPKDAEKLSAAGEVTFSKLTMPPALAPRLPAQLAEAELNGRARLALNGADLDLDLHLEPSRLGPEAPIAGLEASGGRRGGAWQVDAVALDAEWLRATARGKAGLDAAELDWDLDCPDLARLTKILAGLGLSAPLEPAGAVQAHGRLRGPWTGPALSLTLNARDLALGEAGLDTAELELSTPAAALPLRGSVRLRASGLSGGDLAWSEIKADLTAEAAGARLNLAGRGPQLELSFTAFGQGPIALPLRARLSALSIKPAGHQAWRQTGQADLGLMSDALELGGLVLTQDRQRLELSGRGSLGGPLQASLRLVDVLLDPWLPGRQLPATSRVDLSADLTGSLAHPRLQLNGRLHGLKWRRLGQVEVDFEGQLDNEALSLDGQAKLESDPVLAIKASLGLEASLHPPRMALTERGLDAVATAKDLPLSILGPLLPGLRVGRGRADLDLSVRGPLARPSLRGRLEVSDASLLISATGQRIDDLDLSLTARGREVVLTQGAASSGGRLTMQGRLLLPEAEDSGWVELKAKGEGLLVGLGALGQVTTDLDLDLAGPALTPQVKAYLQPRSAVIHTSQTPPASLNDVVVLGPGQKPPPLQRQENQAPRIMFPGPLDGLSLDARVDLDRGLRVVVDDGWVNLGGVVRVTKASGGPLTFHDRFTTDNGAIFVESRRFVITRGQFIFAGKDTPDPNLNVDVNYRTGSTQIFITVQGSAFTPQLQLSSEPPMSQADILSVIIFGRPAGSLNAGESRTLSAQALALLGQGSRREIEKILGPSLSPDVVTVHNDVSTGSSLEAGKYLSSDLYLRYRQNLSSEGGQNIGLEYRINDWLSLDSQVGTTRDSGVDVIFSYEFK